MPNLGDYLGQLLGEIAMARVQADLEMVRIAELYAAHPILKTLPIPHLRLPSVELDIPVVIEQSQPPREGETVRGGAGKGAMLAQFVASLEDLARTAGIALEPGARDAAVRLANKRVDVHGLVPETSIHVRPVAEDLGDFAIDAVHESAAAEHWESPAAESPMIPPRTQDEFRRELQRKFLGTRSLPPRLSTMVATGQVQEAGSPQNITRIRMKVTEQGFEWTVTEADGERKERLVPE